MVVTLSSPRAASGTIGATCAQDAAATELQVSSDPNLRLDIVADNAVAPPDLDQREIVSVYLTVGDRWPQGPTPRVDTTALQVFVSSVEADVLESRMLADASSSIEINWTVDGGTLRFARLVPETRAATGAFIDLAGTVAWSC